MFKRLTVVFAIFFVLIIVGTVALSFLNRDPSRQSFENVIFSTQLLAQTGKLGTDKSDHFRAKQLAADIQAVETSNAQALNAIFTQRYRQPFTPKKLIRTDPILTLQDYDNLEAKPRGSSFEQLMYETLKVRLQATDTYLQALLTQTKPGDTRNALEKALRDNQTFLERIEGLRT